MKRTYLILGIAALAVAGVVSAQDAAKKSSSPAAERGKEIFSKKCAICHFADSDAKKIGPGLKGLYKRGTFSVNHKKVTDENLTDWIEHGDTLMPPFKDVLPVSQIKDVVAYVKTL